MKPFVIKNECGTEFWSNDNGWTDIGSATHFTQDETRSLNLPTGGTWVTLWEVNCLQFTRFIAECEACGVFNDEDRLAQVAESMDIEINDVYELVSRAQEFWDNYKDKLLG
jgi:hypothetical protein